MQFLESLLEMDIRFQQLSEKNYASSSKTFISSTMWTDRLGFIAANTTLKKLNKLNINKKISNYGKIIKRLMKLQKK